MWVLGVCESRPWAHPPSCRHRSQPQQCLLQKCGSSPASSSAPWPLLCKVSSVCVHAVLFVSLMLLISRTIYKENQHLFSGEKSWDTRKLGAAFHCISIIWRQCRLCLISVRIRKKNQRVLHMFVQEFLFFSCVFTQWSRFKMKLKSWDQICRNKIVAVGLYLLLMLSLKTLFSVREGLVDLLWICFRADSVTTAPVCNTVTK